jgi:hypothetical protein
MTDSMLEQFYDVYGIDYTLKIFNKHPSPLIRQYINQALSSMDCSLANVRLFKEYITQEMAIDMFTNNPDVLQYLPHNLITTDMMKEYIATDFANFHNIPSECLNFEVYEYLAYMINERMVARDFTFLRMP